MRTSVQAFSRLRHSNGGAPAAQPIEGMTVSDEAIAHRAYHRFLARGCTHGFDREDWEEANRELVAEASRK
jgi:hypothetical protein